MKSVYDQSLPDWKMILLKLIDNTFGNSFEFHSNLVFDDSSLHSFPTIIELS